MPVPSVVVDETQPWSMRPCASCGEPMLVDNWVSGRCYACSLRKRGRAVPARRLVMPAARMRERAA